MNKRQFMQTSKLLFTAAAAMILLTGCDGASNSGTSATDAVPAANIQKTAGVEAPQAQAPAIQPAGRGPILTFKEKLHNLGTIWDVDDQSFDFSFTNMGDRTLIIQNVKASCGCTTPTLAKNDYAPGESGTLGIRFDPRGHGVQHKTLTVTSNAVNEPSVTLTIQSNIQEFVAAVPPIVQFNKVRYGQAHKQIVRLTSVDSNLEILEISSRSPYMTAQLMGGAAGPEPRNSTQIGRTFLIEITLDPSTPWGQTYGALEIQTRGRINSSSPVIDHKVTVTVNAVVFGDVIVEPLPLQLGLIPPGGQIEKSVKLVSGTGKPFRIVSAEFKNCPVTGLRVDIVPITTGAEEGYMLNVVGPAGDYLGIMRGDLHVITDLPGEAPIDIPLRGAVREPIKE